LVFSNEPRIKACPVTIGLLVKDFLVHGLFGLSLLYLLPLTLGSQELKKRLFYPTTLFHYPSIILSLLVEIYLIRGYLMGLNQSIGYTFYTLFVIIIVIFCILTFRFKGEQDNRLYPSTR